MAKRSTGEDELRSWAFDRNYDEALHKLECAIGLLQTNLKLFPKPSRVPELKSNIARLESAKRELERTIGSRAKL